MFSGDGYFVDCLRYEAKPRKDGASGESQSDVINVTSDEREMFLTLVSIRLTSTGLHMRYQNLRENTHDFFSGVELQELERHRLPEWLRHRRIHLAHQRHAFPLHRRPALPQPGLRRLQAPRHRHGLRGWQPGRGLRRTGKAAGAGGLGAPRGTRCSFAISRHAKAWPWHPRVRPRQGVGQSGLHHDQQAFQTFLWDAVCRRHQQPSPSILAAPNRSK